MNLKALASILQAAATRAEELAIEAEETAETRRQEAQQSREQSKAELVASDTASLISLVAARPGLSAGELIALLQTDGFSQARAQTAISSAITSGAITTTKEGAKTIHTATTEGES